MEFFKTHRVANMTFPTITISPEAEQPDENDSSRWMSDMVINHAVLVSVRVHTKYRGDAIDTQLNAYYMDEIIDVLNRNRKNGLYRVMKVESISYNETFEESGTTGAQANILLHRIVNYPQ